MHPQTQSASDHRKQINDTIRLGRDMLHEAFEALHSTVACDNRKLRNVGCGWPTVFRELNEIYAGDPPVFRRTFTPKQLSRAEKYCSIFSGLNFPSREKKATIIKTMNPGFPWKKVGAIVGEHWTRCRNNYDGMLVAFVYAVSEAEAVPLGQMLLYEYEDA